MKDLLVLVVIIFLTGFEEERKVITTLLDSKNECLTLAPYRYMSSADLFNAELDS